MTAALSRSPNPPVSLSLVEKQLTDGKQDSEADDAEYERPAAATSKRRYLVASLVLALVGFLGLLDRASDVGGVPPGAYHNQPSYGLEAVSPSADSASKLPFALSKRSFYTLPSSFMSSSVRWSKDIDSALPPLSLSLPVALPTLPTLPGMPSLSTLPSLIGLPDLHAPLGDEVERTGGVDHGRWTLLGRPTHHHPGAVLYSGRPAVTDAERQRIEQEVTG